MKNKFHSLYFFMAGIFIMAWTAVIIQEIPEYLNAMEFEKWQQKYPKLERRLYNKVSMECEKNKIDKGIIFAVIYSESRFNQYALSETGAIGFMQLMPDHHQPKSIRNKAALYDLDLNIEIGVSHFAFCLETKKGNVIAAASMYERGRKKSVNVEYLSEIWENIQ